MIIWFHTSAFRSTEYLSHQIIVLKLSLHKLCSLDGTSFLLDRWYTIFRWSSVSVMVWHAISCYMSVLYLDIFSLRVCWLSISLWLNVSCLFRESWSWSFPCFGRNGKWFESATAGESHRREMFRLNDHKCIFSYMDDNHR